MAPHFHGIPPTMMGDGLQTCFNLFPTALRINQCVGIFSATLLSMSAAIVHHELVDS
jgi:hypothetical protein